MTIEPRLDIVGAALADPSRTRILCELMDGRAFTNKELACAAGISPQTASSHLSQLQVAGLTSSIRSGRHVYHKIANALVADAIEALANLSPIDHLERNDQASADTRCARSCYNHIAGKLGVRMTDRLVAVDILRCSENVVSKGNQYARFVRDMELGLPASGSGKAPAKLCLDWTERRHHISGPLATAIMQKSLGARWIERRTGSRALTITTEGFDAFQRLFGFCRSDL